MFFHTNSKKKSYFAKSLLLIAFKTILVVSRCKLIHFIGDRRHMIVSGLWSIFRCKLYAQDWISCLFSAFSLNFPFLLSCLVDKHNILHSFFIVGLFMLFELKLRCSNFQAWNDEFHLWFRINNRLVSWLQNIMCWLLKGSVFFIKRRVKGQR